MGPSPDASAKREGDGKQSDARAAGRKPLLSDEQKRIILAAIEAGATDHVAARVAGISSRKLRELRQRAEDRHSKRPSTPELREFIDQVDEAIARARMKREIEVAERDAKFWLSHQARSKPGLDGWSEPIPEPKDESKIHRPPSLEELREVVATLVSSGAVRLASCGDETCGCSYHTTPEVLA